jgi:hypothetical protein
MDVANPCILQVTTAFCSGRNAWYVTWPLPEIASSRTRRQPDEGPCTQRNKPLKEKAYPPCRITSHANTLTT